MPGILCEHCTGVCCRYIALPIDHPDSVEEFDYLRWYLIHRGVSIFVEDGDWYICFQTTCQHLQPDHRCGIYATRPRICRQYSTDNCDYHSGDYGWQEHFTAPEHLDAYLATRKSQAKPGQAPRGTQSHRRTRGVRAHPAAPPQAHQHGMVSGSWPVQTKDRVGIPLPTLPFSPEREG